MSTAPTKPRHMLIALVAFSGIAGVQASFDICVDKNLTWYEFLYNGRPTYKCGEDFKSERWKNCQLAKNHGDQPRYGSTYPEDDERAARGKRGHNAWLVTCPYQTLKVYYDTRVVGGKINCKEGGTKRTITLAESETKSQSFEISLSLKSTVGAEAEGIKRSDEGGLNIGWAWSKSSTKGATESIELSCPTSSTDVKCIRAAQKRVHVHSDQCWIVVRDGYHIGDYWSFDEFRDNGIPVNCVWDRVWQDQFEEAAGAAEGSSTWYMWQDQGEENCSDEHAYMASTVSSQAKRRLDDLDY